MQNGTCLFRVVLGGSGKPMGYVLLHDFSELIRSQNWVIRNFSLSGSRHLLLGPVINIIS